MSLSNYKTFENWRKKNSPPSLKMSSCPYVNTYKKWRRNTYKMNTAEELVIILESSDSGMSEEDEDNSLEGILPLSPDSE
jgi:hypothetical protein